MQMNIMATNGNLTMRVMIICCRNASDLTTLCTTSIIPVDLNAFILQVRFKGLRHLGLA